MARPREFDEDAVLNMAIQCFWAQGYEATSIRDLVEQTGLTAASLYNAFGDKRSLYQKALDRYVDGGIGDRINRCEKLAPRAAIEAFFAEILKRSLTDREHKGCMLVNAALEMAPHDPEFREIVAGALMRIETFFLDCVVAGQAEGTVTSSITAKNIANHLLALLMGIRVLARARPERALLEGAVTTALKLLDKA